MPKRNFETLDQFKANLHKDGATLAEMSGQKVPCILVSEKEYHDLLSGAFGRIVRAEPVLDIFYDGKDVFVDVQIKFSDSAVDMNFLFYANGMMEFFEALAETGLLGISPSNNSHSNSQNMFTIQLAKRDAAEHALEIIKANALAERRG